MRAAHGPRLGGRLLPCIAAACLAYFGVLPASAVAGRQTPRSAEDAFVDSLLARMTLEEKVGQLTQWRGRWGETGPVVPEGGEAAIRAGKVGSFLGVYGAVY